MIFHRYFRNMHGDIDSCVSLAIVRLTTTRLL